MQRAHLPPPDPEEKKTAWTYKTDHWTTYTSSLSLVQSESSMQKKVALRQTPRQPSTTAGKIAVLIDDVLEILYQWQVTDVRRQEIVAEIKRLDEPLLVLAEQGYLVTLQVANRIVALIGDAKIYAQIDTVFDGAMKYLDKWQEAEDKSKRIEQLEGKTSKSPSERMTLRNLEAEWADIKKALDEQEEAVKQARPVVEEVQPANVKEWLCPPLKRGVKTVNNIAIALVPTLVTLDAVGALTLTVPITPLVAAGLTVLVSSETVNIFCRDEEQAKKKDEDED